MHTKNLSIKVLWEFGLAFFATGILEVPCLIIISCGFHFYPYLPFASKGLFPSGQHKRFSILAFLLELEGEKCKILFERNQHFRRI
jgi:hypothetical protein